MSRRFRIVAADVDGTLVDERDRVRPRVREAIRAAVAQGVEFVLATGRGPRMVREIIEQLDCPVGLVMGNGAIVAESLEAEPIAERLIPPEIAIEAVELYRREGYEPLFFDDPRVSEQVFYERTTDLLAPFVARNSFRLMGVPSLVEWLDHPPLMMCTFGPEAAMRELAEAAGAAFEGRASVQPMLHPKYDLWVCDLFAPGCDKWSGLLSYAAWRGVGPHELLAIGDGLNDLPMIVGAGWGVAMANADAAVKAAADEVVADNDHDGVAEAVERYVLPACGERR